MDQECSEEGRETVTDDPIAEWTLEYVFHAKPNFAKANFKTTGFMPINNTQRDI